MNLKDLSTQLLFTTVPIWAETSAGVSSATAFIYNVPIPGQDNQSVPLLVTNHHVIAGARRIVIEFIEGLNGEPMKDRRIRAEIDSSFPQHVDERLDLAALAIGPLLNQLQTQGRQVFFRSIGPELVPASEVLSDLSALEDVVFIGYPSGLRDQKNSNPLIRRGITSTPVWNDFEGQPCFLIDAGVFPGSSGSPVFILNQGSYATREGLTIGTRLLFLGVIAQTMTRVADGAQVYLGLGRVVRSDAVKAFLEGLAGRLTRPA